MLFFFKNETISKQKKSQNNFFSEIYQFLEFETT
jgi:hypothetical protein